MKQRLATYLPVGIANKERNFEKNNQTSLFSKSGRKNIICYSLSPEATVQRCSLNKFFWKVVENEEENASVGVALITVLVNVTKKEALTQVFSCEFCEMFQTRFFAEHVRATASVLRRINFFWDNNSDTVLRYRHLSTSGLTLIQCIVLRKKSCIYFLTHSAM